MFTVQLLRRNLTDHHVTTSTTAAGGGLQPAWGSDATEVDWTELCCIKTSLDVTSLVKLPDWAKDSDAQLTFLRNQDLMRKDTIRFMGSENRGIGFPDNDLAA